MKDYKIAYSQGKKPSEAIEELEKSVQGYLKLGWEPQGGVSVTTEVWYGTKFYIACQAMIKNE